MEPKAVLPLPKGRMSGDYAWKRRRALGLSGIRSKKDFDRHANVYELVLVVVSSPRIGTTWFEIIVRPVLSTMMYRESSLAVSPNTEGLAIKD